MVSGRKFTRRSRQQRSLLKATPTYFFVQWKNFVAKNRLCMNHSMFSWSFVIWKYRTLLVRYACSRSMSHIEKFDKPISGNLKPYLNVLSCHSSRWNNTESDYRMWSESESQSQEFRPEYMVLKFHLKETMNLALVWRTNVRWTLFQCSKYCSIWRANTRKLCAKCSRIRKSIRTALVRFLRPNF